MDYTCMTCSHPVCFMRGKETYYCGNYTMDRGIRTEVKRSESEKDRVCVSPSNSNRRNSGTGYDDNIADT